jgi:hypothetical protein
MPLELHNVGLNPKLDLAQRGEVAELVRHAPATDLGLWLKQHLEENGGIGFIPFHQDDTLAALLATMASTINALNDRVEELEEASKASVSESVEA